MIKNVSYGHEKKWGKALTNLMTTALMSVALIGCGGEGGGFSDIPGGPGGDPSIPSSEGFSRICNSGTATAEQSYTIDRLFEFLDLDRGYHTCDHANSSASSRSVIDLRGTGIKDVSVLSGFPEVEMMLLSGNLIDDLSALRNLPNLEILYLSHNPIRAVPDLRHFTRLFHVNLSATEITSLNGIEGLSPIVSLTMGQTAVTDWSRLAQLPKLSTIKLANLAKPESLKTLPAGRYVSLKVPDNGLTDLTPIIEKMPDLQTLEAQENQLTSLQPVAKLDQLRNLDVRDNRINSIAAGVLPRKMNTLNLSANPLRDFAFAEQLEEVVTLDLSSTGLSSIKPILPLLDKATNIYLQDTQLNTLEFDVSLLYWRNLKELDLSNTPLTSLSAMTQVMAFELAEFTAYGTPAMTSKDTGACPTSEGPYAVQFFCVNGYGR